MIFKAFVFILLIGIASPILADEIFINIKSPLEGQIIQRTANNSAEVTVSGTCPKEVVEIQIHAMVEHGGTGSDIDWTSVENVKNGTFSGKITIPAGGWYILEARGLKDNEEITASLPRRIGVGDIFVIAGEYMASNIGSTRQKASDDRVMQFDGKVWKSADDPQTNADSDRGSPWPILGGMLSRSLDIPIGIASIGAINHTVNWWLPGSEGYKRLYDIARALGVNGLKAMLWQQGESDALEGTQSEDYEKTLVTIINKLNTDSGYKIPWFVAGAAFIPPYKDIKKENSEQIRKAQKSLWLKKIAYQGATVDDLFGGTRQNPFSAGRFRYDLAYSLNVRGMQVMANRWFAMIWSQLYADTPLTGMK